MSWTKLFSSIVTSSIWYESDPTLRLWIYFLATCDRTGTVYGSRIGIAHQACIAEDKIEEAFGRLMGPDPNSSDRLRAPENEGRRLEEVPGGYRILNYDHYRGIRDDETRAEQNREAQARFRAKRKPSAITPADNKPRVITSNKVSPPDHTRGEEIRRVPVSKTPSPLNSGESARGGISPGNGAAKYIPTVEEVQNEIEQRGYHMDPQEFVRSFIDSPTTHKWQSVLRAFNALRPR